MTWALMVDRGQRKGMIIPIQKSPFLIGRDNECQLRPANPYVSGRHCELLIEDDKFVVRDCNSTNGTFLNSQRIQGQVELHEGDHLDVGALAFVVCLEDLKPIEEQTAELPSPIRSQPVEEKAAEDILLKLDEEDTQSGPRPAAWQNPRAEDTSWQPSTAREPEAEKPGPENKPTTRPSDVARGLLKGRDARLKRRS